MLKGRQAGASPGRTREGSVLVGPPGKATESAGHGSGQKHLVPLPENRAHGRLRRARRRKLVLLLSGTGSWDETEHSCLWDTLAQGPRWPIMAHGPDGAPQASRSAPRLLQDPPLATQAAPAAAALGEELLNCVADSFLPQLPAETRSLSHPPHRPGQPPPGCLVLGP